MEAMAEPAPTSSTSTGSSSGVSIHPHIYSTPPKSSDPLDFAGSKLPAALLQRNSDSALKSKAQEYAQNLTTARAQLVAALDKVTAPGADEATSQYLQLLVGLISPPGVAGVAGNSNLRSAVNFSWQQVIISAPPQAARDAVFELASVLVALAVWRMRRAALLCQDSQAGVSTELAVQGYKLVREAAGILQCAAKTCGTLLKAADAGADCSFNILSAAVDMTLADAQSITVLRSIQKGNAATLVTSLAADTAQLYQSALTSITQQATSGRRGGPLPKLQKYVEYKLSVFRSYSYSFAGLAQLNAGEAGRALRSLEEARQLLVTAQREANLYDQAQPSTPRAEHELFDKEVMLCRDTIYAKCKRENDAVYFQPLPRDPPLLPEGKRLTTALPYELPPAAQFVASNAALFQAGELGDVLVKMHDLSPPVKQGTSPSAMADEAKPAPTEQVQQGSTWWRWLLAIIALPFLAVISLIGAVVWLVLLPVKIFCCPIGCLVQLLWDLVEVVIKAPARALLWASGKPWQPKPMPAADVSKV